MKKLSLALVLALICISMFSCGEKSVVNPLSEDFKITTFSPISGFTASEVTLFGENLTKDSIVSVTFGEQTAEILSRTDSLLIVKVPDIAVGQYDITVKTKTKSYVYDKKFEVLIKMGITTFFPASGYINTKVSLFGENLDKDSVISVQFGNQNAEILSYSKDSILVKVPNILTGKYDIIVKTKTNSYLYDTKYEVLALDFSRFKNYKVSISGLNLKFNTHHILKDISTYEGDWTNISSSFSKMYYNNYKLEFSSIDKDFYRWTEYFSTQGKGVKNSINMSVDEFNGKIKSLHADFYESSETSTTISRSSRHSSLNLELADIDFSVTENESTLSILLYRDEITAKMKKFDTGWFYSFDEWQGHCTYSEDNTTLLEILGINDNATIEIKFTK